MARVSIKLRRNADDTLTVRVGRMVEHIGIEDKDHGQVFDAVKYALISKGVPFTEPDLVELLMKARAGD